MPATARRPAVAVTPHHQRGWELCASYAAITWGVTGAVRTQPSSTMPNSCDSISTPQDLVYDPVTSTIYPNKGAMAKVPRCRRVVAIPELTPASSWPLSSTDKVW